MKCPFCLYDDSKVTDSRVTKNAVRRRRECLSCQKRFTTFEMIDLTVQVKKRDGSFEDFDQEKLLKGIVAASRHSGMSYEQVKDLVNCITEELVLQQRVQISSQELGEIVMEHLKKIDVIAYIRFACVYKRIKHLEQLIEAMKCILPSEKQYG